MIDTERLCLKPFSTDDLDIIYKIYSDREIMRYMPLDYMDEAAAEKHLKRIVLGWSCSPLVDLELLVSAKETGEKIGRCHIQIDAETDSAMVGWLLLKKEWNKGYATEIGKALLDYSFDALGVHRAFALCNPENAASRRVLEKCGMRLEAHFKQKCRYVKDGIVSWEDEMVYAILKNER